jgi:hypothetical protein
MSRRRTGRTNRRNMKRRNTKRRNLKKYKGGVTCDHIVEQLRPTISGNGVKKSFLELGIDCEYCSIELLAAGPQGFTGLDDLRIPPHTRYLIHLDGCIAPIYLNNLGPSPFPELDLGMYRD